MKKALLRNLVVASALLFAQTTGALASNCAVDQYDHNGSTMEVYFCDEGLNIAYDRPRYAIRKNGVKPGTILFEGSASSNGLISGQARVFKRGCGAATYPVSGRQSGDRIILRGRAPVRRKDCSVKRYRNDKLVFDLIGG